MIYGEFLLEDSNILVTKANKFAESVPGLREARDKTN
jgi:hypothetical protein